MHLQIFRGCRYRLHVGLGQLLFLADGRLFVRRSDGTVGEADPVERAYAHFVLTLVDAVYWRSDGSLELTPLADS